MKKILLASERTFRVEDCDTPAPGPGEVLVRMRKVGVCGSDMHLYRSGCIGDIKLERPLVLGHECMGVVAAVGAGVAAGCNAPSPPVGTRVAVEPEIYCGRCPLCLSGRQNLCTNQVFLGLPPRDGAMQEYLVHPAHLVAPLPDSISDDAAVALEPMAIALHGVRLAKVAPGKTIVILGTGVMGTCVLAILGLYRGLKIICVDLLPDRLKRAEKMGAAVTILAGGESRADTAAKVVAATGGAGADIVFECAGADDTLWSMCDVAAAGGHVMVIGTNPVDRVAFASSSSRRRGLTIRFVRRSLNTLAPCIDFAKNGLLRPESIVTHTFPAKDAAKAYDVVDRYADGVLKALVDMGKW